MKFSIYGHTGVPLAPVYALPLPPPYRHVRISPADASFLYFKSRHLCTAAGYSPFFTRYHFISLYLLGTCYWLESHYIELSEIKSSLSRYDRDALTRFRDFH